MADYSVERVQSNHCFETAGGEFHILQADRLPPVIAIVATRQDAKLIQSALNKNQELETELRRLKTTLQAAQSALALRE